MKNFGAKWLALAAVIGAVAGLSLNGCGGGGGGGTGKGGTTGSAGSSAGGKGGTTSTAGTGGSSTGRGGTGGTAGTGGSVSTAGTGGSTGGTGGSAGGTGGTGGTPLNCPKATFNTADEGFVLNIYNSSPGNLATREAGTKATAAFDSTMGDPSPGDIKIDAPFDNYSELVDLVKGYSATTFQDWTGGTKLHVRVKVANGFNPDAANPAGVMPYVQTTSGFVDCRVYDNVIPGNGWNDYVLDFSTCSSSWKINQVIGFGVQLDTGNGAMGDGGTNPNKPAQATIYVDSFWLDGTCSGTAGTGGSTGGTGGSTGGTGGTGGTAGGTGGSAGRGGTGGTAGGTGGTAGGTGGTAGGTGGTAGGTGGTGGAATTTLYDFENGVQSWATSTTGVTVAASPDQHFDGAQSLKITHGGLDNANLFANVNGTAVWPGTVLTFHVYLPTGFDTSGAAYFQAVGQGNNYAIFDTAGNGTRTATAGAWNTWTYTVPNTFPGGFQALGFQLGDNSGGTTIAAGSVYLDAITATGGTQNCALATPTAAHTFELAEGGTLDANVYKKDGSDADTVASQSTDQANGGTGSWKVAFTALPPISGTTATSRRVFIAGPNIYCGQVATVHVYLPTGSDGMTFQAFAQYNNYGKNSFTGPATVTRGAWNTYAFTVPSDVGPGGIQQLGVQFNWSGTTAFTGNVYIDDITW